MSFIFDYSNLDIAFAAVLVVLFITLPLVVRARKQRQFPLPPGPPGYPIIGNLFDIPAFSQKGWEIYAVWGERYGKIMSLRYPGKIIIILNDLEVATELLDKKGAIHSGRPLSPMVKLGEFQRMTTGLPYNSHLKAQRKFIARAIGTAQHVTKFHSNYEYQSCMFLKRLLAEPNDLVKVSLKSAGAVQLDLAYGYKIQEANDPFLEKLNKLHFYVRRATKPAHFMVDIFPFLRFLPHWLPGAGFKNFATEGKRMSDYVTDAPYEVVQQEMAAGIHKPSFVSDILSKSSLTNEQVYDLKWAASILYAAGSDTMAATIRAFILMMTLHPQVQDKVHAEIDRVVGNQRLPTFEDRPSLPYLQATMKEALRLMPPGPLALLHQSTSDDIQDGYFIPSNSTLIVNVWNLLRDSKHYRDPLTFRPERHLGQNPELDPYKIAFGFGRRVCPGMHVADAFVWIAVARVAATLSFEKAKTEGGEIIEPVCDLEPGISSRPVAFLYNAQVRHKHVKKMIEESIQGVCS